MAEDPNQTLKQNQMELNQFQSPDMMQMTGLKPFSFWTTLGDPTSNPMSPLGLAIRLIQGRGLTGK